MTRADLLVRGCMVRADGTLGRASFRVLDGRVHAWGDGEARETLDVGGKLVLPGAIDPHVHFRDPGDPAKEDFQSGTRSAARGGVTTVLDMPNTKPPVFTDPALADKVARAQAKACVDFGIYCGLDAAGASLAILPRATAMKIYLGATTGNLLVRDPELVRRALLAAARAGRTVVIHAESQACLDRHAHLADDTYRSHATSRPAVCEAEAIDALREAASGTGASVHVAHLSSAAGLTALEGSGFTAEVAPHHLLLTHDALEGGGPFKMNPPLRAAEDTAALWRGLADGRIACLASDHAPHTPAEKRSERMPECPAGVPGVATLVPLLLPRALAGDIPLARLVDAMTAAGRIFRLPGKRGLQPGSDADFAVYDPQGAAPLHATELESRAGWTPFEGMPGILPSEVFVRGAPVVRDGAVVGAAGSGRFLCPP